MLKKNEDEVKSYFHIKRRDRIIHLTGSKKEGILLHVFYEQQTRFFVRLPGCYKSE